MNLKSLEDLKELFISQMIKKEEVDNYYSLSGWFEEDNLEDIEIKYHNTFSDVIKHYGYSPEGFFEIYSSCFQDEYELDPSISDFTSRLLEEYCEVLPYFLPTGGVITVLDHRN